MENKAQGRYGWQEAQATASTRSGCTANRAVASPAPREHVHGLFEAGIGPASDEQGHRQDIQDDGVGGVEEQAGQVVTSRVEFPEDILRLEEQPGQRLVNAEPERSPGPLHLGCAQTTEIGVVEEVLIVVPIDEAVVQGGDEGGDDDQARAESQPARCAGPRPAAAAGSAWNSVPRQGRGFRALNPFSSTASLFLSGSSARSPA